MNVTTSYRFRCLLIAFVLLALAFASKFYYGPYWRFSNAYLGDVFIVGTLYFFLSIGLPTLAPLKKALIIALVALCVELFQATGIPASWGLPEPFSFVLGTAFDWRDFIFYSIGLLLALGLDKRPSNENENESLF